MALNCAFMAQRCIQWTIKCTVYSIVYIVVFRTICSTKWLHCTEHCTVQCDVQFTKGKRGYVPQEYVCSSSHSDVYDIGTV